MLHETKHDLGLPPVQGWFFVKDVPSGEAPLKIRKQWVNSMLPVREKAPIVEAGYGIYSGHPVPERRYVPVYTADAIGALSLAGKFDAARWWSAHEAELIVHKQLLFSLEDGELIMASSAI